MSYIAAGVGLGTAAVSIINGISQRKQAQRLANANQRPTEPVPQGVLQADQLAQNQANEGLPGAQYAQAQQNIQRAQAAALQANNDRRGGLTTIPTIQQGTNDANLNLDVQNANARIRNRQALISEKENLGQWQDKTWGWNNAMKYQETAAASRALLGAGNQNINSGLDRTGATLINGLGNRGYNGLFGRGQTPSYNGVQVGAVQNNGVDPYGYDLQGTNNVDNSTIG
jgi:hypothetical protein